ncbi:uncharacterized protein LACBIDRAFT_330022 [Laccaria bicolor S238N-H82]|uniref:Predicted protein n=1 Tax=Laccaria bicolor (strain S238N-H82 / ATCC MYA-4686) TaxID=486041 RepID=B0DK10_LACBS|nr:uncharacterized protein LACBIDRAFT_330022 [Laccaria bicolor S238N-H82]EDR04859.1 predicted protein [Laccaria bicolor S238N-H82]|eukprot:XP_001884249.1 predicted protein [Laccaria bicolor S238N-H82]
MYAKEHLSFDPRRAEQWVDEVLKIRPPAFTRDSSVVANLLWKDDQEFQEVLCYWSSRFRAILTSKLENPIDPKFENCWLEYMSAELGFIIATLGMACAYGHKFIVPPFLKSCLQGNPLHPQEAFMDDCIRPAYEFAWWNTRITFPPGGIDQLLKRSYNWFRWMAKGGLPIKYPDTETSTLTPAEVQHIKTQLENARDRLLERIKRAEAEEEWVTNEISVWEEIVQQSALIDLMRYHKNRFSAHRNPGGESPGSVCHGQPLRPLHPKPFPNLFVPKVS